MTRFNLASTISVLLSLHHALLCSSGLQDVLQDFKKHNSQVEAIQKNANEVYSATHLPPVAASARLKAGRATALTSAPTQTSSYLSLPELDHQVQVWFGTADQTPYRGTISYKEFKGFQDSTHRYANLYQACLEKERELSGDYFVFYHAHPTLIRIVQDLDKQLYQLVTGKQLPADFIFLRSYNPQAFELPPLQQWLDQKVAVHGAAFNNNLPDVQPYLLSANFSFFARMSRPASNTFLYFLTSRAGKPPAFGTLVNFVISAFTVDDQKKEQYIKELYALDDLLSGPTGDLLQIFLPISIVDSYVYLSGAKGVIWNSVIDQITAGYDEFKQRYTALSPVLEAYKRNPMKIKNYIDKIEARIYLHGNLTRDPATGMKVFRHSTSPLEKQGLYNQKINKIAQDIYDEWRQYTLSKGDMYKSSARERSL